MNEIGNRMSRFLRLAAIGLGCCLVPTLIFGTQNYVVYKTAGQPLPWLFLVGKEALMWLNWLLVSPLIFAAARRFPVGGAGSVRNILIHLPIGIGISYLSHILFAIEAAVFGLARDPNAGVLELMEKIVVNSTAIALMIYGVIVTVYFAIDYYRAYQRRALAASQLEARLAGARLDLLRMQIHPHFLFNTLNGISMLMARDVQSARRMIACLSDLLRLSLEQDAAEEVSLDDELAFLGRYVEIQKMRFADRLQVKMEIDEEAREVAVPRLLLQPIVENSIRHGISRHARPGLVEVAAHVDGEKLRLTVRDNGPGLGPGPLRQGVGLGNTRARIEQLYGKEGSFSIGDAPGGGSLVEIVIPIRREARTHDTVSTSPILESTDDAEWRA